MPGSGRVGTNVNLAAQVQAGGFREDLYFRINVLPVKLPPLSERRDEIPAWSDYMAERHHQAAGRQGAATVEPAAKVFLEKLDWPGNLRQLDNIVRRSYALALSEARGTSDDPVKIALAHVQAGLSYDDVGGSTLAKALLGAGRAFVGEVSRRANWDLDLAEALKGYVLAIAVERYGIEEAFRVLGRESLIVGRNHHKVMKRELDRVRTRCMACWVSRAYLRSSPPMVGRPRAEFEEDACVQYRDADVRGRARWRSQRVRRRNGRAVGGPLALVIRDAPSQSLQSPMCLEWRDIVF